MTNSKIPIPVNRANTVIKPQQNITDDLDDLLFVVSFKYFQRKCVQYGDFHNYYKDRAAAHSGVIDLFRTLGDLSCVKVGNLVKDKRTRQQWHWNLIKNGAPLQRIEDVLRKGYKMPSGTVDQFEGQYTEFAMSNGQRVISIVNYNIVAPLFLDPNHLICQEGKICRDKTSKLNWCYPSFVDEGIMKRSSPNEDDEVRKMILGEVRAGNYENLEQIIKDMDE